MPDFFIAQEDMQKTWLVEVKYRKKWNDAVSAELGEEIAQQVKDWGPLHLIVFLGSPGKEKSELPSSWFGVLKLQWHDGVLVALGTDDKPYAWSQITWKDCDRVQDLFTTLSDKKQFKEKTLLQVRTMLPQLAALRVFE